MTLWFVFALMTAAAVLAVLWPLGQRVANGGGSDVAVYRDQLDEIGRDRASGLIGEAEAEAAKVEVSRRLIAAADAAEADKFATGGSTIFRRRVAAIGGLVALPAGAAALYLILGSPQLPGEPLAERLLAVKQDRSLDSMVAQVEAHLEKDPNDARGYEVLAPIYLRSGRLADAVKARRKVLALGGETATRQADLGEALTAAANGIVTAEAKSAFERALVLDPQELKSRFFIGLAAQQDGQRDKAGSIWRAILDNAPVDAPWVPTVREALAGLDAAAAPGPGIDDLATASRMSEAERGEMIRGMVARLAGKLKDNGDDIDGWQRLLRAYIVLGERDKARAAATDARRALAGDPAKRQRIDAIIKSLGLEG